MSTPTPTALVDVFVLRDLAAAASDNEERLGEQPGEQPDNLQFESCLVLHGVVRQRSYLSADGRRLLYHFRAPDAESLRTVLRGAGIEYDSVWSAMVRDPQS